MQEQHSRAGVHFAHFAHFAPAVLHTCVFVRACRCITLLPPDTKPLLLISTRCTAATIWQFLTIWGYMVIGSTSISWHWPLDTWLEDKNRRLAPTWNPIRNHFKWLVWVFPQAQTKGKIFHFWANVSQRHKLFPFLCVSKEGGWWSGLWWISRLASPLRMQPPYLLT